MDTSSDSDKMSTNKPNASAETSSKNKSKDSRGKPTAREHQLPGEDKAVQIDYGTVLPYLKVLEAGCYHGGWCATR
jgi:hypothetical protein